MGSSEIDCGLGLICDGRGNKSDCNDIQAYWKPLLDGSYCPSGTNVLEHCPKGSYCPDTKTKFPCPKGYFCPHKTMKAELKCSGCKEGATELVRHTFGYIAIIILLLPMVAFVCLRCIRERKLSSKEHREKLQARLLSEKNEESIKRSMRKKNDRLRPKLNAILKRVGMDQIGEDEDCENAQIIGELFDALDSSKDSFAQYEELNVGMKLNDAQSKEFIKLMNKFAGKPLDAQYLDKDTFVKYFCRTIEQSANYDPSPEECARIFEVVAELQTGNPEAGTITLNGLYETELMFFLSYPQINDIIKALGKISYSNEEVEENQDELNTLITRSRTIDKATFIEKYPFVLSHIVSGGSAKAIPLGVDITFQNLSLHIKADGQLTPVVNKVSGRLERKTMTALMGGSGAGKSSLLSALCGRAFYGEVSGTILINGYETSIEKYSDVVGFVPQDDIVYAELTVRENLIYAGRFRLPKETTTQQIEDLADEVMANLGLTRVANNIVGSVTRRGVSGGEKKRVNIGLELMAEPSILFLDEPTSGLDANSALLVMNGLRNLVEKKGVTVCSVIHQPRKVIFGLFDSLILLGVGGNMVYHGKVDEAEEYFENIGFDLPLGESVADWFIDISTGRLERRKDTKLRSFEGKSVLEYIPEGCVEEIKPFEETQEADKEKENREKLYSDWQNHIDGLGVEQRKQYEPPKPFSLPQDRNRQPFGKQVLYHMERNTIVQIRNMYTKVMDTIIMGVVSVCICLFTGKLSLTKDSNPNWRNEYEILTLDETSKFIENEENVNEFVSGLYNFSVGETNIIEFSQQITIVLCALIAIAASKMLVEKRVELFREAGSGYNLTAYYLALNISSAIEHTIQMVLIALPLIWLRCTVSSAFCLLLTYVMMGWLATSWSLLFPIIIPPKNVVIVLCSFIVFFCVIFSGLQPPAQYKDIYSNKFIAFISGMFSSSRYFTETLLVSDNRALPPQTGWTFKDYSVSPELSSYINDQLDITVDIDATDQFDTKKFNAFNILQLAQQDIDEASTQSSSGWYYQAATPFFVGLTIRFAGVLLLHCCNRSEQARCSVIEDLKSSVPYRFEFAILSFLFLVFLSISMAFIWA